MTSNFFFKMEQQYLPCFIFRRALDSNECHILAVDHFKLSKWFANVSSHVNVVYTDDIEPAVDQNFMLTKHHFYNVNVLQQLRIILTLQQLTLVIIILQLKYKLGFQ